ncbi:Calmodulin [Nymphaea thermarum]|nr:Calmodulin [Nymphaea thermarum]
MCPSGRQRPSAFTGSTILGEAFAVLDADGDGRIGADDLRVFHERFFCESVDEKAIQSMISVADVNDSGFVEIDEFERVLSQPAAEAAERKVLEDVFRAMDRDGDGIIGSSDLKDYMRSAGMPVSDGEVRTMMRMGGGDEVKGVSFDAMVKILTVELSGSR